MRRPGGGRAQRPGIGTRVGFGQGVRAQGLAAQHPRQEFGPLCLGAERGHRVAGQCVHTHADGDGGPARGDLLQHLEVDRVGLTPAADVLTERQGQQPDLAQETEDLAGKPALVLELGDPWFQFLVRDVRDQFQQVTGLAGWQFTFYFHCWALSCGLVLVDGTTVDSALPRVQLTCRDLVVRAKSM